MTPRKNGNGSSVALPTDSWYGGRRFGYLFDVREFAFPRGWQLEMFEADGVRGATALSEGEIRQALQEPIATESLRRLAEGRRNAIIIVDDLSRPTPAFAVVPDILDELSAGGLRDEDITIIIGLGTHRPLSRFEQRRKLGTEVLERVRVVNHNAFTRKLSRYNRTNGGPDFAINRIVGEADLKISVSGVISHGGAGFGGGAKAILPSVAAYETIMYNHETFDWEGYGIVYPHHIESACIRRDMEEVAAIVGLDFSVNLVFSPYKEILGVYAGHFIDAHRAGSAHAHRLYLTEVPSETMDVVIVDGYPLDTDIGQSHRGTWAEKYGQASVLLAGARDGWAYHGDNGKSYATYRRLARSHQAGGAYTFKGTRQSASTNGRRQFYFSSRLQPEEFYRRNNERSFYNQWEALIEEIEAGTNGSPSVGIFPYAPVQVEGTSSA